LASLTSQVASSAKNLSDLQRRVTEERSATERAVLEQMAIREAALREAEARVEHESKHNASLLATFAALKREHEEERGRLREEHARLQAIQTELTTESAVLREQLVADRERYADPPRRARAAGSFARRSSSPCWFSNPPVRVVSCGVVYRLRREQTELKRERADWDNRYRTESAELDAKRDTFDAARAQAADVLEGAQRERSEALNRLETEREELRREILLFNKRRTELTDEEEAFRFEQSHAVARAKQFEEKMGEMTAFANRLRHFSAEANKTFRDAHAEKQDVRMASLVFGGAAVGGGRGRAARRLTSVSCALVPCDRALCCVSV
jgi:hypothetical protein